MSTENTVTKESVKSSFLTKTKTKTKVKKELDLTTFEGIVERVIKDEGDYVNDPDDSGGETKYGISKRSHSDIDVKNLTKSEAIKIYKNEYWDPSLCDKVPSRLKHIYFDMCVNFGTSKAIGVLQKAANSAGNRLVIDGKLGPLTLGCLKKLKIDRVRAYRVLRFAEAVASNPRLAKFWVGWYRRAEKV